MTPVPHSRIHVTRPLDLGRIEAIGFDLDHTLAVYRDDAVNRLATEETVDHLVRHRGYPDPVLEIVYDGALTARSIVVDLEDGHIIKYGDTGNVLRARRSGVWMRPLPERIYAPDRAHPIHSPFDLPTAFLFDAVAQTLFGDGMPVADARALCAHVRSELDRAHTAGLLKTRIMDDLASFIVRTDSLADGVATLRARGIRTFVLTNSEALYAARVLAHLFGAGWRELFDAVVVSAGKPAYFDIGRVIPGEPAGDGVVAGGSATGLEAALGVTAPAILYVGDHAGHDITPATRHGWKTAHVVPEIDGTSDSNEWGSPFAEDEGTASWFAALVRESADLVVASVADLVDALASGPDLSRPHTPFTTLTRKST